MSVKAGGWEESLTNNGYSFLLSLIIIMSFFILKLFYMILLKKQTPDTSQTVSICLILCPCMPVKHICKSCKIVWKYILNAICLGCYKIISFKKMWFLRMIDYKQTAKYCFSAVSWSQALISLSFSIVTQKCCMVPCMYLNK